MTPGIYPRSGPYEWLSNSSKTWVPSTEGHLSRTFRANSALCGRMAGRGGREAGQCGQAGAPFMTDKWGPGGEGSACHCDPGRPTGAQPAPRHHQPLSHLPLKESAPSAAVLGPWGIRLLAISQMSHEHYVVDFKYFTFLRFALCEEQFFNLTCSGTEMK